MNPPQLPFANTDDGAYIKNFQFSPRSSKLVQTIQRKKMVQELTQSSSREILNVKKKMKIKRRLIDDRPRSKEILDEL